MVDMWLFLFLLRRWVTIWVQPAEELLRRTSSSSSSSSSDEHRLNRAIIVIVDLYPDLWTPRLSSNARHTVLASYLMTVWLVILPLRISDSITHRYCPHRNGLLLHMLFHIQTPLKITAIQKDMLLVVVVLSQRIRLIQCNLLCFCHLQLELQLLLRMVFDALHCQNQKIWNIPLGLVIQLQK